MTRPPRHPGKVLQTDFLEPLGVSQSEIARRIHVSFPRVNEIVNGRRGITPDTELRLSRLLGTTPEFWLDSQRDRDLWKATHSEAAGNIESIQPLVP